MGCVVFLMSRRGFAGVTRQFHARMSGYGDEKAVA
jgi:hypothetical protein